MEPEFAKPAVAPATVASSAPDPGAVERVATRNGLPVDRVSPVTVLDPYFYH